jgi:hypothetical protein
MLIYRYGNKGENKMTNQFLADLQNPNNKEHNSIRTDGGRIILNKAAIYCSSHDAANMHMRKHNRKAWNDEDNQVYVDTYYKMLKIAYPEFYEATKSMHGYN